MVIALIPARGGSKGISRKNLVLLAGKPLISYTIEAAKKSNFIDEVWVSSDDLEILSVASDLGVKGLSRPTQIADDSASGIDVVHHFLLSLSESVRKQDPVIVYLQPTSPLRTQAHIDLALKAMEYFAVESVVSVIEADKPPQKAFQLDKNGCLISLFDERLSNARRQDLPRCYYPNGAIYAFRMSAFQSRQGFPSNGSFPFIMQQSDSIDIDSLVDLDLAELAMGKINA